MVFLFVTHIIKSLSTPTEPNPTPKMSRTVCKSSTRENSKCKVCFDAKKDEKMYMSHRTKNEMGVVICPTLTNQACLRCNKKGHTVSRCTVKLEKGASTPDHPTNKTIQNAPKKTPKTTMFFHRMAELELSDDESEEKINIQVQVNKMTYAAILAKTKTNNAVAVTVASSQQDVEILNKQVDILINKLRRPYKNDVLTPTASTEEPSQQNVENLNKQVNILIHKLRGPPTPKKRNWNWADMDSDSDSE